MNQLKARFEIEAASKLDHISPMVSLVRLLRSKASPQLLEPSLPCRRPSLPRFLTSKPLLENSRKNMVMLCKCSIILTALSFDVSATSLLSEYVHCMCAWLVLSASSTPSLSSFRFHRVASLCIGAETLYHVPVVLTYPPLDTVAASDKSLLIN